MQNIIRVVSYFCFTGCLFHCAPAIADSATIDPQQGWARKVVNISWSGSGIKKDMRGVFQRAEGIYSGSTNTEGNVAFTCYGEKLSVNVALENVDLGVLFSSAQDSTRRKIKRADIKVNGAVIKSSDWIYMPAIKVFRARKKSTAAKLYNAVIRGSKVEMKSNRSGYVVLNLPDVDNVFRNFGADCGLGVLANKK